MDLGQNALRVARKYYKKARQHYRRAIQSYKILIILSFFSLLLGAVITNGLNVLGLIFAIFIAAIQYFISLHGRLFNKFTTIERLTADGDHMYVAKNKGFLRSFSTKKIVYYLALSPFLFQIHWFFGICWTLFCFALYVPRAKALYRRYKNKTNFRKEQIDYLECYEPKVAVYVTGLKNVSYQINQWIDVLEKLSYNVVIVLREKNTHRTMLPTKIPVFYAKRMRDLELFEQAGVKTVLYPANTQKNVQFLRLHKINHFFINHGESDKVVNQSKLLMAYDKLLVAGPMAKRRLVEGGLPLRENQIEFVGRPQTELKLSRASKGSKVNINNILYAPTWEGFVDAADYSSVTQFGLDVIKYLAETGKYNILFKPHPYTGSRKQKNRVFLAKIKQFCLENNIRYEGSNSSLYELMNESDVLISDVSSVMNEYLYTLKPIFLTNTSELADSDFKSKFPSSGSTYLISNPRDIAKVFEKVEANDDLFSCRVSTCEDSLGVHEEGSLKAFDMVIAKSLNIQG